MTDAPCPCGARIPGDLCCAVFIGGEQAPRTPAQLMRSRYTAYVLGNREYLLSTWHASSRPASIEFEPQARWLGLRLKSCAVASVDDDVGEVEFVARYKVAGRAHRIAERSQFVREFGRWYYVGPCR
ncbi:MAG: SEC-C motif-containing protein [Gammaproteobacteria bacterium]